MKPKLIVQIISLLLLAGLFSGCVVEQEISKSNPVLEISKNIKWLRSASPYGHTGIILQANDQVIYLDPVNLENEEGLSKADIILITHNHEDHFSVDTISKILGENTKVVSIAIVINEFSEENAVLLEPGEKIVINDIEIEGVPAYNNAHSKYSKYLGFVINIGGVRVYCSGDTDLTPEMESLTDIDIAVLNVRNNYSLSGKDVIRFVEIVHPKYIVPIHWMPDDDAYQDKAEIEYIQQNILETTGLLILELK